jgi:hypothetical protein
MPVTFAALGGRTFHHQALPQPEPVYVAEHRPSTDAHATPNTGFALLVAWLHPVLAEAGPLAMVRLPSGPTIPVDPRSLFPAEHLAQRRIFRARPAAPARTLPDQQEA